MKRASDEPERERLERVFRGYRNDPQYRRRWSHGHPGNIRIERERDSHVQRALAAEGRWPPVAHRILDVGCGAGGPLAGFVEWGTEPRNLVGIDLLAENVQRAERAHPGVRFIVGDASSMDLPTAHFQLVLAYTIFSSILDRGMAEGVASEIDRLLEPGGSVVWYDYRISHPLNPNTRGMPKRAIRVLFPNYDLRLKSVTLVPQIARSLGPFVGIYPALAAVPLLRTHYVGLLRKPG